MYDINLHPTTWIFIWLALNLAVAGQAACHNVQSSLNNELNNCVTPYSYHHFWHNCSVRCRARFLPTLFVQFQFSTSGLGCCQDNLMYWECPAGRLFRQTAKISKGVVMGLITGWGLSAYAVAKQQGWIAIVKSQLGLAWYRGGKEINSLWNAFWATLYTVRSV